MSPDFPKRLPARVAAIAAAAALLLAPAAHALRLMDYNVLNYPGTTGPARDPYFRTVIQLVDPDVLVAEEMTSSAGTTEFLNSLNTMEPGQWAALPFVDGNDTDAALFYKPSKIGFATQWSFYPDPPTNLRLVHVYRIRPAGYTTNAADIRLYVLHLKASTGFESQRLTECTGLRDSMNAMPTGTHGFALGDFNFYTGAEPGLTKLLENQADNDGRLYDVLGLQGISWQDNTAIQSAWTQSPCKTGDTGCANGAATGGLDDRFDLILPTLNWNSSQGYGLIAGSYISVGNDGLHHNNSIKDPPTIPEGADYANALHAVSDHLPVRVDLRLPARVSAPASLAFGTVIVGAAASQNLSVSNVADAPADGLTYQLAADAGFSAPGGTYDQPTGASAAVHAIGMDTGAPGAMSGNLAILSDDYDNPTTLIPLSGTVIDHAQASLDSTAALLSETLDFGSHEAGQFTTLMARVHDRDYQSLRARLALNSGVITGGDGRFSIVGGFTPSLVAGVAQTSTIQFDDSGAALDTDYDATLTFASTDEALPGAAAQPALTVSLHAKVTSGTTGVGDRVIPTRTRLYPPFPNPLGDRASVKLDLAREGLVRLEVYDLTGRRVATLAEGDMPAGQYTYAWDGRARGGAPLGSGLYFVRLRVGGAEAGIARVAILR